MLTLTFDRSGTCRSSFLARFLSGQCRPPSPLSWFFLLSSTSVGIDFLNPQPGRAPIDCEEYSSSLSPVEFSYPSTSLSDYILCGTVTSLPCTSHPDDWSLSTRCIWGRDLFVSSFPSSLLILFDSQQKECTVCRVVLFIKKQQTSSMQEHRRCHFTLQWSRNFVIGNSIKLFFALLYHSGVSSTHFYGEDRVLMRRQPMQVPSTSARFLSRNWK